MKNNVPALKGLKNVYITARESESESEIWVWGKITPQAILSDTCARIDGCHWNGVQSSCLRAYTVVHWLEGSALKQL